MKTWHIKATLEFDLQCDEYELYDAIKERMRDDLEELDVWDEEFIQIEDNGEVDI